MDPQTADIDALVALLGKVDPKKPYGTKLFDALARLSVSVAVEAVCFRQVIDDEIRGKRHTEVYLTQRAANDTAYPGQWHCPGSVMRPGEEIADVMGRLNAKELDGKLISWEFVANVNNREEERGHFFSLVYRCKLEKAAVLKGSWFPLYGGPIRIKGLPEKTVEHHRTKIIPALWVRANP